MASLGLNPREANRCTKGTNGLLGLPWYGKPHQLSQCYGAATVVDSKVGEEEEEEELCLICWCDPAEFGLSVSCTHLFCRRCIKGHLTQIQKSASFLILPLLPGSSPGWRGASLWKNHRPAMTFLQRKGLFDKEFQFRFMRKQNEQEELSLLAPTSVEISSMLIQPMSC